MNEKYSIENLQNSKELSEVMEVAEIQAFGTVRQNADLIRKRRSECEKRGYHRVDVEPEEKEELMICYDCEIWFSKEDKWWINYKVEPL